MRPVKPTMRLLGGRATAAAVAGTAFTPNAGDGANNAWQPPDSAGPQFLLNYFGKFQTAGFFRVHGQRMANDNDGFRVNTKTGETQEYSRRTMEQVFPQDQIKVDIAATAVAGDIENINATLYDFNSTATRQSLIDYKMAQKFFQHRLTLTLSVVSGAGGGITGETAISPAITSFFVEGNEPYALIGYEIFNATAGTSSLVVKGPDTGQYYVGGPGSVTDSRYTCEYFLRNSVELDLPFIICMNSSNLVSGATTCGVQTDENAGTFIVNLILWKLHKEPELLRFLGWI